MYCASKAEHDSEIKDALEEKVEMRNLLREFIKDQRVLVAIAKDCRVGNCKCLYCRAKVLV